MRQISTVISTEEQTVKRTEQPQERNARRGTEQKTNQWKRKCLLDWLPLTLLGLVLSVSHEVVPISLPGVVVVL